jgi:hypothetical protein
VVQQRKSTKPDHGQISKLMFLKIESHNAPEYMCHLGILKLLRRLVRKCMNHWSFHQNDFFVRGSSDKYERIYLFSNETTFVGTLYEYFSQIIYRSLNIDYHISCLKFKYIQLRSIRWQPFYNKITSKLNAFEEQSRILNPAEICTTWQLQATKTCQTKQDCIFFVAEKCKNILV